jgi:hypothetical protein
LYKLTKYFIKIFCGIDNGTGIAGTPVRPKQDATVCLVCMECPSNAILLECGHAGICGGCATRLWESGRRCPLCRETFTGAVRVVQETEDVVSGIPKFLIDSPRSRLQTFENERGKAYLFPVKGVHAGTKIGCEGWIIEVFGFM